MKKLLTLLLLATAAHSFAQDWPVKKMVMAKKVLKLPFATIPAFNFVANKTLPGSGIYQELQLNTAILVQLMQQRPATIQLSIPITSSKSIVCELVKISLGNIKFTENGVDIIENVKIPVTYRGVVAGETAINNVTLTVNDDYLSLTAAMDGLVLQVTKGDEESKSVYRLYNSAKVKFPDVPFTSCGTKNNGSSQTASGIKLNGIPPATPTAVQDKCVGVFVDCFDSLYYWRDSSKQQTINYVYELFNYVTAGYYNELINLQITTINVWTTPDPYRGDTRENALYDLAAQWQDNFWGNICVGLDYSPSQRIRSGIADGIGKVKAIAANTCPVYSHAGTDSVSACCYNELNYVGFSTQNFPTGPNTTGAQVYLVMHEIGHLLGARHTQWCGWKLTSNPDTFGALDSCAATEAINNSTPPCPKGQPPPANGGTIMSYCTAGVGGNFINYRNGFGTLPGNAIRNFVDQSACILNCSDCFGLFGRSNNDGYAFNSKAATPNRENSTGPVPAKHTDESGHLIISKKIKQ